MEERVVLGLGSNKGWGGKSPLELLEAACRKLSSLLSGFSYSSVYVTEPMYLERQAKFLNMVVSGVVPGCEPDALLARLHELEAALGRERSRELRNGPRSMDIDIELFGERRVVSETLEIPHPRMRERAFVLVPMMEILGESADSKRYEELFSCAKRLGAGGVRKLLRFEGL